MALFDDLFVALKNIGIDEVPLDILNISSDAEKAVKLLEKVKEGQINTLNSLSSYLKDNFQTGLRTLTDVVSPEQNDGIIDVEPDDIHTVTIDQAEKLYASLFSNPQGLKGDDTDSEEKDDLTEDEETKKDVMDKTASLWQYKPVPEDEPEPYDEYITGEAKCGRTSITAARVRGKKHKHDGTNCDDWFAFETTEKWTVAAVSDGAGSKKFSRIGAMESCSAAVSYLKDKLEKTDDSKLGLLSAPLNSSEFMEGCGYFADIIQESVIKAYSAVEEAFESRKSKYDYLKVIDRDMEFRDFSGTLLLCIVIPAIVDGNTENFVVTCQIGDGIICSVDRNAQFSSAMKLLGEPDSGQYSGETDFLTSNSMQHKENLMAKTRIMRGKNTNVLMMTDGVADDYYPNNPQLLRLVLDLELNGILKTPERENENGTASDSIPEPVCYPWVNDNQQLVALQYADKLMDSVGCSLEELWSNNSLVHLASLESFGTELPEKSSERLQRWLDNYVQRGSFDDRTMLIINTAGN